jgi:Flp pilus assembly protein TadG
MKSRGRRSRRDRGSALVEFALVLPCLAMIVFGAIDLGRVYRLQNQLKNASREGAAFAQFYPGQVATTGSCADPNNVRFAAVQEEPAVGSKFTVTATNLTTNLSITGCNATTVPPGTRVQVTVSAPFKVLTPLVSAVTGSTITVKARTSVVVQG